MQLQSYGFSAWFLWYNYFHPGNPHPLLLIWHYWFDRIRHPVVKKLYKSRSLDRLAIINIMNIMKIISFIVGSAHLFMPTLSLNLFKPKILQKFSNSPFGSINMADTDQINALQCSRPCQRVPNFVKLSSVLIQYGIPQNIVNSIEAKESNSYGEVDIGKCIGSCRHVQSQILTVSTEKTAKNRDSKNKCFKKSTA